MAAPFISPKPLVADQLQEGENVITILSGSLLPQSPPWAPAALYDIDTEQKEIFPLHKIVQYSDKISRFITFHSCLPSDSIKGQNFVYRPWWTAEAWDLITDTSLVWHKEKYPNNGDHSHCPFTWEAISAYAEPNIGYRCGKVWITEEAYEKFIRDDVFACRENSNRYI